VSDELFSTRLRWDGRRGIAKLHGKTVQLEAAPNLTGEPVHYIDYTPEIHDFEIRRAKGDRVEEMTAAEIAAADRLLALLTQGA
jgi:hypothetical protein